MEDNKIKLYTKFPIHFYFIVVGLMIILPLFNIIFIDIGLKEKLMAVFLIIFGICMFIIIISANMFHKIGYIITKDSITAFSFVNKKEYLWNKIVNYSINGNEKKNDLYLRFYTEESLKNKGILKPKYVISIATKYHKLNIDELIEMINEIKK